MNKFYHGDCLFVMSHDIEPESVDLIYLDPPFFTGKVQKGKRKWEPGSMEISYEDSRKFWGETVKVKRMQDQAPEWLKHIALSRPDFASYLFYMMERLQACHRVLKPTGSIYLHCDWRASHYLKFIMDDVFGLHNFQNDIIWHYHGRGMQTRRFQRKHDNILFYHKSSKATFNRDAVKVPINPNHVKRYDHIDSDGRHYALIKKRGGLHTKVPLKDGIVMDDVWEMPFIHGSECVGYPTQKPEALLERIIKASSKEDSVVLDPFCGCGTTIAMASKLGRQWIGIDISRDAYEVSKGRVLNARLESMGSKSYDTTSQYISRDLAEVQSLKAQRVEGMPTFEEWVNGFYKATKPHPDKGVDGICPDGTPIQSKTNLVQYDILSRFLTDVKLHPAVSWPVKRAIIVSQSGFDDSAFKRKFEIETSEGIELQLLTPERMLEGKGLTG